MKILIGLHHLELGGSQLNAVDLAYSVREDGHQIELIAPFTDEPGPVLGIARELGFIVHAVKHPRVRQRRGMPVRLGVARAIDKIASSMRADVVHCYEYPMILDAFHYSAIRGNTRGRVVGTIYGMDVPSRIPSTVPLVVGTDDIRYQAAGHGHSAYLIEPPVNTALDKPDARAGIDFRRSHGVDEKDVLLVVVSRLEPEMKLPGILDAIDSLRHLPEHVRMAIVGDGPSRREVRLVAESINRELKRTAVIVTGPMVDPRGAYAAADICLGMGGSAIRAMAHAKPVIALGINGFSKPVDPSDIEYFRTAGFYGTVASATCLADHTLLLLNSDLKAIGAASRKLVCDQYSLASASCRLIQVYDDAVHSGASPDRKTSIVSATHRALAEFVPSTVRGFVRKVVAP